MLDRSFISGASVLATPEVLYLGQSMSQSVNYCQLFENVLYVQQFTRILEKSTMEQHQHQVSRSFSSESENLNVTVGRKMVYHLAKLCGKNLGFLLWAMDTC